MPLSVQLLAMSQSSQRNISGFIKTKGKTYFSISDSQPTQVIILDIDNQEGKKLLLEHQTKQNITKDSIKIIALTLSPSKDSCSSIIQRQKPITSIELIRAAEKIRKLISNNQVSSSKINKDAISEVISENKDVVQSYEPSGTLQGMLRKAVQLSDKEKTSVVLHIQNYRIEINASNNLAYLSFPKNRLRNLCYYPLNTSTCLIKKESLKNASEECISLSIAELSWNTALLCARGRSPKNLDNESTYQLKRWPNLTRWLPSNYALSIASLWTKAPYSITAISQQLDIPITDVRCFISAALDSHLAIICKEACEVIPFKTHNNSSLFKKLLNHLKRA
ncbi:MAG: hypothetical protein JKY50_01525 [Oleispira sp.]|nr:hypothetical protein [Oleispira sp.]MBL4879950.1 hypothetical protein [Oleispira sp.]